jgi:hypothetical protein
MMSNFSVSLKDINGFKLPDITSKTSLQRMCNYGNHCFRSTVIENSFNIVVQTAAKPQRLTYLSHTNHEIVMVIISQISCLLKGDSESH